MTYLVFFPIALGILSIFSSSAVFRRETEKHRRIRQVVAFQSLLGSLQSYDFERCIAAVSRHHVFAENGNYTPTLAGMDDYVPNVATAIESITQVDFRHPVMKSAFGALRGKA